MECVVKPRCGGSRLSPAPLVWRRPSGSGKRAKQAPADDHTTTGDDGRQWPRRPASRALHSKSNRGLLPLLPATGRGRRDEKWWQGGWLHCRYDAQAASLSHLRRVQSRLYGTFNFPALLTAPSFGDAVLHRDNDEVVVRSDFPGLLEPGMTVGDVLSVLSVEWVQPRHLRFHSRRHAWPMNPTIVKQFRRYCDTLVHNFPALLLPHNEPDELQPRSPSATTWRVRDDDGIRVLVHEQVVNEGVDVGIVQTMAGAAVLVEMDWADDSSAQSSVTNGVCRSHE